MRVALLIAQLGVGGAERQFTLLARGLCSRGHEVVLTSLYGGGELEKSLHGSGVLQVSMLPKRPRPTWTSLGRTRGALQRHLHGLRPDVVYAGDYVSNLLAASTAPALGIPVVWGVPNEGIGLTPKLRMLRLCGKPLRHRAVLAIANSSAGIALHRRIGYLPESGVVIPNGVDVGGFRPARDAELEDRAGLRRRLGVPASALLAGLVARYSVVKDHPNFLGAVERTVAVTPGMHFLCAAPSLSGFPPDMLALAESGPLAGQLHFLEAGADPRPVYRALDVLVSSSVTEGLSNVILEAMACGVPCIVTDVGDSAFAVGDTGFVVPARDPEALAEALARFVRLDPDERVQLGRRGRERVVREFGLERLVARTEAALAGVARSGVAV